jgi:hypothetical protein
MEAGTFKKWLVLVLGLLIWPATAWWLALDAQQDAASYARLHAETDKQGIRTLIYDNPFQVGQAKSSIRPAPDYDKPLAKEPYRKFTFAWRWLAAIDAPVSGDYLFVVGAADAVRLRVDGRSLIERWVGGFPNTHTAMVHLEKGLHLLDLQNVQTPNSLNLKLAWTPPGKEYSAIISKERLHPLDDKPGLKQIAELYHRVDSNRMLVYVLPALWLFLWWLALRDLKGTWKTLKEHRWFLAVLLVAGLTRLLWCDVVHGIAGESAFFSWRAGLILEGAWPYNGMTTRTGPLFDYMMAVPLAIFGPSAWLHRIAGDLPNALAIIFCYRAVSREAGRPAALAASLLLAVLPGLVIFGRMPGDNTSLGLLFMFIGLDQLSLSRQRPARAIWAGILWGLAFFNHSIFAILFITLGGAALLVSRFRLILMPQLYGFGLGTLIGFLPRILDRLLHPTQDVMSFTKLDRMAELPGFLKMFMRTLDGDLAYRTFVGSYVWDTHWLIPIIYLAAIGYLLYRNLKDRAHVGQLELWLILALLIHLALVPLGAPSSNPRYYLYALVFTGLIGGLAFGRAYDSVPGRIRPLLLAGLVGFALFNLASLGVNYFYAHLSTGGQTGRWHTRLLDHTPDAWMDHSRLARFLANKDYKVVATGDRWHHTLHLALNLYHNEVPPKFVAVDIHSRSHTERAAVFYNSNEGEDRIRLFLRGHAHKGYKRVALPPELAKKYTLLERVGSKVTFPDDVGLKP